MKSSTSTYEVNDPGFDLLWPKAHSEIGKKFYTLSEIKASGWVSTPGDLIFYCQNKSTTRSNKITHVAFVMDSGHILHARNPTLGVLVNDITLYDGTICAVTRFRESAGQTITPPPATPPTVSLRNLYYVSPYMRGDDVKEVQAGITRLGYDCGKTDGIYGLKTFEAVKKFQAAKKLKVDGIVGPATRKALGI